MLFIAINRYRTNEYCVYNLLSTKAIVYYNSYFSNHEKISLPTEVNLEPRIRYIPVKNDHNLNYYIYTKLTCKIFNIPYVKYE